MIPNFCDNITLVQSDLKVKNRQLIKLPVDYFLFFGGELFLACKAQGALEVCGNVFPLGAGSDAALLVAYGLVIFPTAKITYMLHIINPP